MPNTKKFKNIWVIVSFVVVAVGLLSAGIFKFFVTPVDINLVSSAVASFPPAPSGCSYRVSQCVKEPCDNDIKLVCPIVAPPTEGQVCSQVAGSCVGKNGLCTTFTNGCAQDKVCAKPYVTCGTRPVPSIEPSQTCTTECSKTTGVCMKTCCSNQSGTTQCTTAPEPTPSATPITTGPKCTTECSSKNAICTKTCCTSVEVNGSSTMQCVTTPTTDPTFTCVANPCVEGMACKLPELPAGQVYCPISSKTRWSCYQACRKAGAVNSAAYCVKACK